MALPTLQLSGAGPSPLLAREQLPARQCLGCSGLNAWSWWGCGKHPGSYHTSSLMRSKLHTEHSWRGVRAGWKQFHPGQCRYWHRACGHWWCLAVLGQCWSLRGCAGHCHCHRARGHVWPQPLSPQPLSLQCVCHHRPG